MHQFYTVRAALLIWISSLDEKNSEGSSAAQTCSKIKTTFIVWTDDGWNERWFWPDSVLKDTGSLGGPAPSSFLGFTLNSYLKKGGLDWFRRRRKTETCQTLNNREELKSAEEHLNLQSRTQLERYWKLFLSNLQLIEEDIQLLE